MYAEYPKWIRHDGFPDVQVANADAEAAQLASWASLDAKPKKAEKPAKAAPEPAGYTGIIDSDSIVWVDDPKTVVVKLPEPKNALLPQLDHDKNGEPGGSVAPKEDVSELREQYRKKFGKRAFPGWKADELKAKLEAE